jgi:hypothetical protein
MPKFVNHYFLIGKVMSKCSSLSKSLLVHWKLALSKIMPVNSFCKHCGRYVHDFIAPDKIWKEIEPYIRHGNTLCYDCFVELCNERGIFYVWYLVPQYHSLRFEELWHDSGYAEMIKKMTRSDYLKLWENKLEDE